MNFVGFFYCKNPKITILKVLPSMKIVLGFIWLTVILHLFPPFILHRKTF